LIVTNEPELAQRIEAIAYPGLTANFDAAKTAALAVTLLDWKVAGQAYAQAMTANARRLASELIALGVPVFAADQGVTLSHQFAVVTPEGGQRAAARLRQANLLACGIGLPIDPVEGDTNGLRIGTPELARLGMTKVDMPALASFIARGLDPETDPATVAPEVTAWRKQFSGVHFTMQNPG
jgi:glycine hydroxymethyltransferase